MEPSAVHGFGAAAPMGTCHSAAMSAVLRVENLWKSYGAGVRGCSARVWALRGCSLTVHAGERVAIAGRPGAGKSTLLHCLAGLRAADAGRIQSGFGSIIYSALLPVGVPPGRDEGPLLYLVDDVARASDLETQLAFLGDRRAALVIATRHIAAVTPLVNRVLTLRDGRLAALPRTPIRRVAEPREVG